MNSIFDDTIAVDYTKSTFSVAADNLLLKLMGAVVLILLMLGWVIWFFFAHLSFYETAPATMQPGGVVVAQFATKSITRIKYEQSAFFHSKNSSGQAVSVPLRIARIDSKSGNVQLWPFTNQKPDQKNTKPVTGEVKISVEQVTPATLILRASGLMSSSTASGGP